jgi:GNAT superfamily N-acetyltransferase
MMIHVADASTPKQMEAVREIMRSFVAWHRERHVQDRKLIDEYFDAAAFDDELRSLPGEYSPSRGRLLLATVQQQPVGCVALRRIDDEYCEMKRMFVYPRYHGHGAGLALGTRLIENARAAGYRAIRLDTSIRQTEAKGLYARLGFRIVEPYYELPQEMRDWLVFMELEL